jgi:hypothetical protein
MVFDDDDDDDGDPKYFKTVASLEEVDSDWEDKSSTFKMTSLKSDKMKPSMKMKLNKSQWLNVFDTSHKSDKTIGNYLITFLDFLDIVNIDRELDTKYSKKLKTIILRNEIFTNRTLLYFQGLIFQKVETIQLESSHFSDEGYKALAKNCPNVKIFQLHGCEFSVNSKCFEVLGPAWPNLEIVLLRDCCGADDSLIMSIFRNCHGIYRFDYLCKDDFSFITDAALDFIGTIKTATSSLEFLTLSSPLISATAIHRLKQKCVNINCINVVLKSHHLMIELNHLSAEQLIRDEEVVNNF